MPLFTTTPCPLQLRADIIAEEGPPIYCVCRGEDAQREFQLTRAKLNDLLRQHDLVQVKRKYNNGGRCETFEHELRNGAGDIHPQITASALLQFETLADHGSRRFQAEGMEAEWFVPGEQIILARYLRAIILPSLEDRSE